jgi:hypothetical protein
MAGHSQGAQQSQGAPGLWQASTHARLADVTARGTQSPQGLYQTVTQQLRKLGQRKQRIHTAGCVGRALTVN